MSVKLRQELEKRIATEVINEALRMGHAISVNDGEETTLTHSRIAGDILAAMFTTDEDWLFIMDGVKDIGWVRFIYGNDGYDVVNDYTTNLEELMRPANELAEKYA